MFRLAKAGHRRHVYTRYFRMSTDQSKAKLDEIPVGATDILFECPACGKSLVVDESAEGLIVDCPQCRTNVVVPPKSPGAVAASTSTTAPPVAKESFQPRDEEKPASAGGTPQSQLSVLASQLKEMQAQRTEITSRIAARLNDVNRDLVMLARLGTSQQQILDEWNRLVQKTLAEQDADPSDTRPVVVGASVGKGQRARVSPRA